MIVCEVKQGARTYVFKSKYPIAKDMWVLCDTARGRSPGLVKECFEVNDEDSRLFQRFLELMGGYEPLKEIIGVFVSMDSLTELFRLKK